jgi:tetratricopeptide (TPR) repeat protein
MSLAALVLLPLGLALGQSLQTAENLYSRTQYREALAAIAEASSSDAKFLAGKCHYGLGDFKKAQEMFEVVAKATPSSSAAYHWLGKALGRRAETASFVTAPRLASQCRQAFEKSVQLDGKNVEAMNDLLEYYLEAPGIMGGGTDKAEALAARLAPLDRVEHQFALARIAEKKKDYPTAEAHLRKAVELAPGDIGRILDLARFLARRNRTSDSDAEFARAAKIDGSSPKYLYARAETWIEAKRNLAEARRLLERYLKSQLTPDDPPRADAEKLLKKAG